MWNVLNIALKKRTNLTQNTNQRDAHLRLGTITSLCIVRHVISLWKVLPIIMYRRTQVTKTCVLHNIITMTPSPSMVQYVLDTFSSTERWIMSWRNWNTNVEIYICVYTCENGPLQFYEILFIQRGSISLWSFYAYCVSRASSRKAIKIQIKINLALWISTYVNAKVGWTYLIFPCWYGTYPSCPTELGFRSVVLLSKSYDENEMNWSTCTEVGILYVFYERAFSIFLHWSSNLLSRKMPLAYA